MGNKFLVLIQNEMLSSCKNEVTNFTSKWIRSKIIIWVVKPILPKAKPQTLSHLWILALSL